MPETVLLATVGASPQVITETLYGIHQQGLDWPDRIMVLTTSLGSRLCIDGLLHCGQLQRLCRELGRPMPSFTEGDVIVLRDDDGHDLDDARSAEEQALLGNLVLQTVRDLASVPSRTIHASLAGGRKTMTFFLGYALGLFGREQDRLTHVLVPEEYVGIRDFWYPSREQGMVRGHNGESLDPALAELTLATIPFIRQRPALPEGLLCDNTPIDLGHLAALVNLGQDDARLVVEVDLVQRFVSVKDRGQEAPLARFSLELRPLALYAALLRRQIESGGVDGFRRPPKRVRSAPATGSGAGTNQEPPELTTALLQEVARILGLPVENGFALQCAVLEAAQRGSHSSDRELKALVDRLRAWRTPQRVDARPQGLLPSDFDNALTGVSQALKEHLSVNLARRLLPAPSASGTGKRGVKNGIYLVDLPIESVCLIDPER